MSSSSCAIFCIIFVLLSGRLESRNMEGLEESKIHLPTCFPSTCLPGDFKCYCCNLGKEIRFCTLTYDICAEDCQAKA
ncbi:hypothetical protein Bca4012_044841 [Brassica carinata]|uniref:BnaC09g53290D protein n=3 Tax=Brassica TaxID=3705 RepID=A0A078JI34_BRANA|nr:hypothetical protein DY000_02017249 [Brassica cretica]KAH0859601.1 hypothetical protein HID58_087862 [Brassica napus]CAF1761878.1 unnamed protein product [Brassica napus]CDY65057.1 BnaC09g53290D [Brassica napus]